MIVLKAVTKKFGSKVAVDGLSLKADSGEIIGFLGPNGAGKTTTMRLLLGYLTPTRGTVTVNNLNPIEDRIEVLKQVGYLPENNPLYQEMTVYEYLTFIASVKEETDVYGTAESVGLSDVMDTRIEELSRGFKQRVGLGAALISNPDLLVLDEPTSGLDPLEQDKIRDLIKSLSKEKTILFSTHILSEVEAVATRLIIINHGKLVYDGPKPKGKGAVEKLFKKLVH
jgi:ABC-2 type transport system ATP-binding protein